MNLEFHEELTLKRVAELEAQNAKLLEQLKIARQYVQASHAVIASCIGHEQTIVRPDLDGIDEAIARAGAAPQL